jgi:glucose-1-phosphate thymidylyltransferase
MGERERGHIMIGIITAAGKSSRMGEPKHCLEHRGKPLIAHALDLLVRTRVSKIIIVYNDKALKARIGNHYYGVPVEYVKQRQPKGIAHAISLCKKKVRPQEMMIVVLGDVYYDGDLNSLAYEMKLSERTVGVLFKQLRTKTKIKESFGMTKRGILVEKPTDTKDVARLLGLGIYFLKYPIFDYIKKTKPVNGEVGITQALNNVPVFKRDHFIVDGMYENVNYPEELK